jgi:hypothetical protein
MRSADEVLFTGSPPLLLDQGRLSGVWTVAARRHSHFAQKSNETLVFAYSAITAGAWSLGAVGS